VAFLEGRPRRKGELPCSILRDNVCLTRSYSLQICLKDWNQSSLFAGGGESELPTAVYALGEVVEVNTRDTAFPAMGPSGSRIGGGGWVMQTAWLHLGLAVQATWLALGGPFLSFLAKNGVRPPFLAFKGRLSAMAGWHLSRDLTFVN